MLAYAMMIWLGSQTGFAGTNQIDDATSLSHK